MYTTTISIYTVGYPDYDRLIADCYDVVKAELDSKCYSSNQPIQVLELGCGTGALTKKVFTWMRGLSQHLNNRIGGYTIVDQSDGMLAVARNRIDEDGVYELPGMLFLQMKFDHNSLNERGVRYDVIFGSLLFHFLIGVEWGDEEIENTIKMIEERWLNEGGCIIWADIFFGESNREKQMAHWTNHMRDMGMCESAIETFFANNRDIVEVSDGGANQACG